jgi:hemerythrin
MAFLDWKDKMSVGNDALDADHKKLLGFINDLHDRMESNPDPEMIERVLDKLIDYAHYHFEFEEKLLRLCRYPELDKHKEKHKEIFDQLRNMKASYHASPTEFRLIGIFDFLSNWLMKHILREDMAYKSFIARKG